MQELVFLFTQGIMGASFSFAQVRAKLTTADAGLADWVHVVRRERGAEAEGPAGRR